VGEGSGYGIIILMTPILLLSSFLLGSIPFGYITGKIKGIDITKTGSNNIGATNVFRTLGPALGIAVFILDMLKGTAPIIVATYLGMPPTTIILAGILAILGHMYSPFVKFKGGKGVATTLGVFFGLSPISFLITGAFMLITIALTKYVSVGSILGSVVLVVIMIFRGEQTTYIIATSLIAVLIIYKHIPNIRRLIEGKENKIWGNKK